jgi:hypothetical protein
MANSALASEPARDTAAVNIFRPLTNDQKDVVEIPCEKRSCKTVDRLAFPPQLDFVAIHVNAVGSREGWVKSLQTLHGADPLHPHAQILFPGKR